MFDIFISETGMTRQEFARMFEKERREIEEKKRAELKIKPKKFYIKPAQRAE